MSTESSLLVPRFLDSFQGFSVKDIKEFISEQRIVQELDSRDQEMAVTLRVSQNEMSKPSQIKLNAITLGPELAY